MLDDPLRATVVESEDRLAAIDPGALHGIRILLAEDGPDNQILISSILTRAGADVVIRENGRLEAQTALTAKGDEQFDCILMDMQMPVMDGYMATKLLRESGYDRPIVALTAHAMAGDRDKCIAAGCDEYCMKPIDRKKIIQLIQAQVASSRTVAAF
jgi:CheY-like chemotaxis protein